MHAVTRRTAGALMAACAIVHGATSAATADAPSTCAEPGAQQPDSTQGAACLLAENLEKVFVDPEQARAHGAAGRSRALAGEEAAATMTADICRWWRATAICASS